jgi:hypothetical protein
MQMMVQMENMEAIPTRHIQMDPLRSSASLRKIHQDRSPLAMISSSNRHIHPLDKDMRDRHMGHHLDTLIIHHLLELVLQMDIITHPHHLDRMAGIHNRHLATKEDRLPITCTHHPRLGMGLHQVIPCIPRITCIHHRNTIPIIHLRLMDIPIIMGTLLLVIVVMIRILRGPLEAMEVSCVIRPRH